MAHWANLDNNNNVIRVIRTSNDLPDEGFQWLIDSFGGTWVKTSYNAVSNGFRKNYAGPGFTYDSARDAFIPPKRYQSWVLNEETCRWEAPIPNPGDEKNPYAWNEETKSWDKVELITEEPTNG